MNKLLTATLSTLLGAAVGATSTGIIQNKKLLKSDESYQKMVEFYHVLLQWLAVKQEGRGLQDYFVNNDYKSIAIYGMKELGECLFEELKDTQVEVKYAIDKKADASYLDIDILSPDEDLSKVDVIVVTAIHYYEDIEKMLSGKVDCPIVSLIDVIYES